MSAAAPGSATPVLQRAEPTLADALRILAVDAVEQAKSGHPGAPMGMAEMATVLWTRHLQHDPADPRWPDRDRFVLSNGHASMLLYGLLHLSGYELPTEELRNFRQLHSRTPGHPEVGITPGVETTTGPLGQGLANAVGMALAEKLLAAEFNRPGLPVVDHHTYVFMGDGCLMEGISHEACSLAGTLRLSKLVALYDDNGISIDGPVEGWFTDDTPGRFRAYGWHVIGPIDGHNEAAVDAALGEARAQSVRDDGRPTLIVCRTVIGLGAPTKAGGHEVHGAPLGAKETAALRAAIGWTHEAFDVPAALRSAWDQHDRGATAHAAWTARMAAYHAAYPALAEALERRLSGALPENFNATIATALVQAATVTDNPATRKASQRALDALAPALPELFGGSADLTGSNLTDWKGCKTAGRDRAGNHMSWGVREFGMAAALNGMALHGGFVPYGGTFLTFSDYSRNAIRMAALMNLQVIHVFTHDSIGLGEDGPTHQSVEHVPSLRLIPNLDVWRPADSLETMVAWSEALRRRNGPGVLALSRQGLPACATDAALAPSIARGGYVLRDAPGARAVIIGTGSELHLAVAAQAALAEQGIPVRVVSMPCTGVFDRQDAAWRAAVLPRALPAVAVEAAQTDFWRKYVGLDGAVVGIDRFGESAPAPALYRHFGITVDHVVAAVQGVLNVPSAG